MTANAVGWGPGQPLAGIWLHNPATGEIGQVVTGSEGGRDVEVDLWLQPGAAVAGAHTHPHVTERFQVEQGEVGFEVAGERRTMRAGDPAVEVATGVAHDWWNAGSDVAHVRVRVEAAPSAPESAAMRFIGMIEAIWSLGALGRVNGKGLPDPLWLAALAVEYRDVIRLVRPPAAVQSTVFPVLAAIARRTGRDPLAPELHGPRGAAVIPDPGQEGLAELLAAPVRTREERGR